MAAPTSYPSFHPSTIATHATAFAILDHPRHRLRRMDQPRHPQQPQCDFHEDDDLGADYPFADAYSRHPPTPPPRPIYSPHHLIPSAHPSTSAQPPPSPAPGAHPWTAAMERIMARLDAVETRVAASARRGPHFDGNVDPTLFFAESRSNHRRHPHLDDRDFAFDTGGGSRLPQTTELSSLGFNPYRGSEPAPRRGTFVSNNHRVFGRAFPHTSADDARALPQPSFSSWDRPLSHLQFEGDDYDEPLPHTSWDAPSRPESKALALCQVVSKAELHAQHSRSSWRAPLLTHTSTPSQTSYQPPQPHVVRESECSAPKPIHVSLAEKSERGRRGLCFYCPEKWVHGHVCHTKLLAYYEEENPDDQQWEDDPITNEENDDAHSEPRVSTEPGVTPVHELHNAEAFVYQKLLDTEAELPHAEVEPLAIKVKLHPEVPPCFTEPVVEVLKRTVHPCMSAAPKLHPSPALIACTFEALYQGPFGLVESMESIWFHVLISRRVFDPGGDISPPSPLCFPSFRSSWFVATWYPP